MFKRLLLRQVYDQAVALGPDSFNKALKDAAYAQLAIVSSGRLISGTAGNGKSVQFQIPPGQTGLTPVAITEFFEEMLTRFDDAVADLGLTTPPPAGSDPAIFATMLGYLRSITGYTSNWMYLSK